MRILFSRMIIKHVFDVIDSRLVHELLTSVNARQLFLHIAGDLFPRNFAFLRNFPKIKLSRNILNLMFIHFFGEKLDEALIFLTFINAILSFGWHFT